MIILMSIKRVITILQLSPLLVLLMITIAMIIIKMTICNGGDDDDNEQNIDRRIEREREST